MKLGPPRTPTVGVLTLIVRPVCGARIGDRSEVQPYGEGWLLLVGTRHQPSADTEAVLAVRAELDRAEVFVPVPAAQAAPPQVPALHLLPPDADPAPAEEPPPVDSEATRQRVRRLQLPVPAALAGLADQPGWSEVIAEIRQGFDRLMESEPFVNQLGELEQRSSEPIVENLRTELYGEVDHRLSSASSARYRQLARGLAAIGQLDLADQLGQANLFTPFSRGCPQILRAAASGGCGDHRPRAL